MENKIKNKIQKLAENAGSTNLAQLDATMELSEKLDDLIATLKGKDINLTNIPYPDKINVSVKII